MWWTITGNFGNLLPIDWTKTQTRSNFLPVLNLNQTNGDNRTLCSGNVVEDEEAVAQDLDMHQLILGRGEPSCEDEPVKTAEEVIREIDDLMHEGSSSDEECSVSTAGRRSSMEPNDNDGHLRPLPPKMYRDKLSTLTLPQLNEVYMELESVISQYSETLITQLALRDEHEYQKELKNTFISLLLQVQNKRRNYNVDKKRIKKVGAGGGDPKYLTTLIPYDISRGPPDNQCLQILNKILRALNEDSPTVPTLLTDYILKVLCPSQTCLET